MPNLLENYQIIITGSTGSLGFGVTEEFNKSGALVFTDFRNQKKFDDLKRNMVYPDRLIGFRGDLTNENEVKEFFNRFTGKYKRLDVFLHIMGGFWMGGDISETPLEKWKFMMDINLTSTFLCTREAFRIMKEQCSGKIFTVSAKTAEEFPPKMGAYAVSKAAVLALTRILANEGKAYDIQVNALLPSTIDTPNNRQSMPDADFSKWVSPASIARLLVHLCRPESKAISHTAIKLYGKL
jgi:NAD(P)-dependent dehydrogenase (short-subunit alcohol dehydrogenase family)